MRRWLLALGTLGSAACVPIEYDWQVIDARFRGILVEVVEPGGYGSLLNVPPNRHRAFVLPLDTVELEWKVAVPPGQELQPPIWIACSRECRDALWGGSSLLQLADCPDPMPIGIAESCRLGEDHRIRVRLGGAYAPDPGFLLLLVGSRRPELTSQACLERLSASPRPDVGGCFVVVREPPFSDTPLGLPFLPGSVEAPPEVVAQEADTNPTVLGFTVTRERGGVREDLVVDLGDAVPVRRGDRIVVEPRFAADAAQEYWVSYDDTWSGPLEQQTEVFGYQLLFSEPVLFDGRDQEPAVLDLPSLSFVVPHDVVPTTLWLDIVDDRRGQAFVELQFVPDDDA